MKFIVFSDSDSGETLVCTAQTETQCVAVCGSAVCLTVNQVTVRVRS
jgi:hypothetical protein